MTTSEKTQKAIRKTFKFPFVSALGAYGRKNPRAASLMQKRRRSDFHTPYHPDHSPFQASFRLLIVLAAIFLISYMLKQDYQYFPKKNNEFLLHLLEGIAAAALILILRLNPVAWTRERPLTFAAPIVFAISLWLGADVAAFGALLASIVHARFAPTSGFPRSYIRFQGAEMAISAFAAGRALPELCRSLRVPYTENHFRTLMDHSLAVRPMGAVAGAALVFTVCSCILTVFAKLGTLHYTWKSPLARSRFGGLVLVYLLGMLPVILLAPLGSNIGVIVGFPLLIMLLLAAQTAKLTLEVRSLRGQLNTAEKMGRASVAESDTTVDPTSLLERFLFLAKDLVSADRALVWIMDQESGELSPAAALPDFGMYENEVAKYGEGLIGHAATRFRPRIIADSARDTRRGRREIASGAWLLYPIVVHEQLLGIAHWIRAVNRPFTSEDLSRLDSLVPQAAVALENVRIREVMHNLASTDGLTGLWNHRRMHDLLREEMKRSMRYHRALSVLMLDVDSFKTFNDTYGHPQGDQLLRGIADILRSNVRAVDHVGRYGGEEFLAILPETSKDDACRMAERIRTAVEELAFIVVEGREIRRTVSVGVASYPEDALSPSDIVQRADDALYRAKRAGKNRVLWA